MSENEKKEIKLVYHDPMIALMNEITTFAVKKSAKNTPLEIAGALMATARNIYIQELGMKEAKRLLQAFTAIQDSDINNTIH